MSFHELKDINLQQKHILEQFKEMKGCNAKLVSSTRLRLRVRWLIDSPQLGTRQDFEVQEPQSLVNVQKNFFFGNAMKTRSNRVRYIVLQSQRNEFRTVYRVSGIFRLPSILSAYALSVQAEAIFSMLHWPSFTQFVSLKNIVPDNSEFMKACDAGDYEKARSMALAGHGSPTDIDEHGQPALHVRNHGQSWKKLIP